jgi:hypothetical protein
MIIDIAKKNNYDYKELFDNDRIIKLIKTTECDINVIVGVKGRKDYLINTINYIKYSILKTKLSIAITVVEIDDEYKNYNIYLNNENVNYIFIPIDLIHTDGLYSRALGFNIGYFFTPNSKYYLFHDCDILVDENFFYNLEQYYINNNFKWLQTFTGKRLKMIQPSLSSYLLSNYQIIDLNKITDFKYAGVGAAGGSTLVKKEIFEEVGGFDPEIFYGYAPEDSMFLTKMCCLENTINAINSCHQCEPIHYADNPPIELYHIYHPLTINDNIYFNEMTYIHNHFWSLNYEDKLKYIEYKRNILNIQKQNMNK